MEDEKQRQANEKKERDKERDKADLVTALSELLSYVRRLMAQGYAEATVIHGVVQATPNIIYNVISPSLKIIPDLHKAKLLGQYINELRTEERLGDDPKLQSIVDQILAITPEKPPQPQKVPVRSISTPAKAPRAVGMFRPSDPRRKELDPGVTKALMGVFFGGLLTATASMIVAAQAMSVGGLAASGFPPVAGVLFVIGGGLLLTSLAFMAYYAYQNRGDKSFAQSFGNTAAALRVTSR